VLHHRAIDAARTASRDAGDVLRSIVACTQYAARTAAGRAIA